MGLLDHISRVRDDSLHSIQCQMTQKLNISFRSFYRRKGQSKNRKLQFVCQLDKTIQNLFMSLLVPNDTLFAYLLLGERLNLPQMAGVALTLCGVFIATTGKQEN